MLDEFGGDRSKVNRLGLSDPEEVHCRVALSLPGGRPREAGRVEGLPTGNEGKMLLFVREIVAGHTSVEELEATVPLSFGT